MAVCDVASRLEPVDVNHGGTEYSRRAGIVSAPEGATPLGLARGGVLVLSRGHYLLEFLGAREIVIVIYRRGDCVRGSASDVETLR